jgi:hypothetical protein
MRRVGHSSHLTVAIEFQDASNLGRIPGLKPG